MRKTKTGTGRSFKIGKQLKIADALPQIFNRTYPVLEPKTQMVLGASLLRFHQIDALPIGFKRAQRKKYAVFGYSCLSKLLGTVPKDYGKFLEQPCEEAALELSTIPITKDLELLLKVFKNTGFGFAWIEGKLETGGFANLRDLLGLYERSIFSTDLEVGDVASPIVSQPADASLRETLTEMFNRRFRRMFVRGTEDVISDRRIIGFVFSSVRLNQVAAKPETLLDAKLGDIEGIHPARVSSSTSIEEAAKIMQNEIEECLICEKGIVTPWDMIMKPWDNGKLVIVR